jgi:hypothetical protein
MNLIQADVFTADLPKRAYGLVYADPPYANCKFKYARKNNSRQWGINARTDYMRELVARMEELRAPDGAAALSMATPELRLMHLFPSGARVLAWVKNWSQFRPGVWPTFAWEPLIVWGTRASWREHGGIEGNGRPGGVPFDWVVLNPAPRKGKRAHETMKPEGFGDWVLDVTLGRRVLPVCELFAGTAPVARAAEVRGCEATGVDFDDYVSAT